MSAKNHQDGLLRLLTEVTNNSGKNFAVKKFPEKKEKNVSHFEWETHSQNSGECRILNSEQSKGSPLFRQTKGGNPNGRPVQRGYKGKVIEIS
jgi:hypothetical protein